MLLKPRNGITGQTISFSLQCEKKSVLLKLFIWHLALNGEFKVQLYAELLQSNQVVFNGHKVILLPSLTILDLIVQTVTVLPSLVYGLNMSRSKN